RDLRAMRHSLRRPTSSCVSARCRDHSREQSMGAATSKDGVDESHRARRCAPTRSAVFPLWIAVVVSCVLLGPTLLGFAEADAQTIGLGGSFIFDEGEMKGERKVSVATTDIDFEYGNDTFILGSIWMLFDVSDSVRMGFAYKYLGTYDYIPEDNEDNNEDETEELGILMEFLYQLEWLLEMT